VLKDVCVYGKISFNNVDCALTNTHLDNTGIHIAPESTVSIKDLG
jgi:hypothetical protein